MPPKRVNTRAKHWSLTIYDATEQEALEKLKPELKFWSWQEEKCPKTGIFFVFWSASLRQALLPYAP